VVECFTAPPGSWKFSFRLTIIGLAKLVGKHDRVDNLHQGNCKKVGSFAETLNTAKNIPNLRVLSSKKMMLRHPVVSVVN
jgi:hypothetical protein